MGLFSLSVLSLLKGAEDTSDRLFGHWPEVSARLVEDIDLNDHSLHETCVDVTHTQASNMDLPSSTSNPEPTVLRTNFSPKPQHCCSQRGSGKWNIRCLVLGAHLYFVSADIRAHTHTNLCLPKQFSAFPRLKCDQWRSF